DCIHRHNQTRMQRKPYCRQERFLSAEKHLLGELPAERFLLKYYCQLRVGANGHVYLGRDNRFYSVPHIHTGARAKVIYTRSMVYIYVGGKRVAVHSRNRTSGGYTTVADHLSSQHRAYKQRSPAYYIEKAQKLS